MVLGRRQVLTDEVQLEIEEMFSNNFLRGHVTHPSEWENRMWSANRQQCRRQLQGVSGNNVVVSETVNEQQRSFE